METQNTNNNKKLILTIASIFALGTAGVMAYNYYAEPKFNVEVKQVTQEKMTEPTPQTMTAETVTYKDGTYTKLGKYVSPGGPEEIEIMVTIEDGVIKDASAKPQAVLAGSIKFQTAFSGGFKELIVGKNIDEIMLDKVAGSSLTPKGFNNAIEQIKMDAKL